MRKWVDRETFDELLISNRDEGRCEIEAAMPVWEAVHPIVQDAFLRYGIVHNEEEHTNYLEQIQVCFRRNGILFIISCRTYPKTTYHITADLSGLHHIDNYERTRASEGLQEPKRIGTLTVRKIEEWVAYETARFRKLEQADAANERTIAEFRQKVSVLPDVLWNRDRTAGTVERHGLRYWFEIHQTGIHERLELLYGCRTLDDFLLLSDNRYE